MGPATRDNDLPEWLKDLGPTEGGADTPPEPAGEGQPDWLAQPQPEAPSGDIFGAPEEEEVPDWLADIRQAEGRAPDQPPPVLVPPAPESSDEPEDWIEPIRARESSSLPADDLEPQPGFIERIQGLQGADAGEEDASADWLSGLSRPEPPAQEGVFGEESGSLAAEWLSGIQGREAPPASETPDWLQGVAPAGAGESAPSAPAWLGEEEGGEAAAESAPPVPDWAAEAAQRAGEAVEEEFPGLAGQPTAGVPSWLADIAPAESESGAAFSAEEYQEAASEVFKIDTGELPDWLAQITPEDARPAPPEEAQAPRPSPFESAGDLAPADLPDWLQAMRPVATVGPTELPEDEIGEAERVGPLAGLAGVLPAEPEIVQFGRPPGMTAGLQLNETQRNYALRLAEMTAAEMARQPLPRPSLALPQRFVRAGLALILILAVAVPQILLGYYTSLPQAPGALPPAEIQAVLDVATGLAPGDTVLLAVDYQPGLAGEVEAAAAGVIDHIIIRGARLALVSTLPTGQGQAEHLLAAQRLEHSDYASGRDYVNLGYLSGGAAGLLQLATDPRAALPVALADGASAWSQPPLAHIAALRDFAAVLVLTDDPDTARAWVEQVQPALADPAGGRATPLLMVASAQAEPLLYPYWQNEPAQINGLVAGLRGGAFYEANIRELRARRYWDAYSAGLTVAVAALAVGAALGLSRSLLGRRRAGGTA
jgi:hypothetical protein